MSEVKVTEVARKLAILRQRFKDKAQSDILQLQRSAGRFRGGDIQGPDLVSVYQSLHRLAGSAGTFGYGKLGAAARALEIELKPLIETPDSGCRVLSQEVVTPAFIERVEALLDLLMRARQGTEPVHCAPERVDEPRLETKRVLIVDPDPDAAETVANGVRLHGFEVAVCGSLSEAVHYDWSGLASVVVKETLLDGHAPELNGCAGLTPMICIGTEDSFERRYQFAARGMDGFIPEPLSIPALVDYIERLSSEWADKGTGRVMIVDDDAELLEHYALVLEQAGLEVCGVSDPTRILRVLSGFRPDLVLMDVQLGKFSGAHLARMLRYDPEWLGLPIVYLSSEENRESQVEALSEGGDDFLTKPVSDGFLINAVKVRCYRARQLDKLVSRDSLTGLLKHGVAKQEILKEHARCQRMGQSSVVAMLDLDHFKRVNDRFGHRTGDVVIKGLSNLLRNRLRKTDVIGRYGGEEFVVVLPNCAADDARAVLQSVCDQLAQIVFKGDGGEFSVTLSIGMAPLHAFASSEDAIEAADQALYQRKQAGRNGVTVAGNDHPPERCADG
ncbi:diguanylate cyclase [Marinobacter salinisoli]|uniref:diguanylate cyclase n=1 Tax=Marinobacter salinisoli TaxID=2769486 RepID=A0ABX7MSR8_9GAMM|nr:diguanylate cyclase [Marinobacter salinisoli]QSP95334.1 diguanylate cyclase [Marinobacter salinisoli]